MTTLYLTPGDDFVYTATVTDENGAAYDLTGATLWFTVKRRRSDADDDAVAQLHWEDGGSSDGITVSDPVSGVAVVRIIPAETALFAQAAHVWDLQVKDTAGVVRTVDQGTLVVLPGVTAATSVV